MSSLTGKKARKQQDGSRYAVKRAIRNKKSAPKNKQVIKGVKTIKEGNVKRFILTVIKVICGRKTAREMYEEHQREYLKTLESLAGIHSVIATKKLNNQAQAPQTALKLCNKMHVKVGRQEKCP